jgi:hypothetical protein
MSKSLPVFICLCIAFFSCQKEVSFENNTGGSSGGTSAGLVGVWKLSSLHAETLADNETNDLGTIDRSVTKSVYDTKQNTGTISFTPDLKAITTNFGYSIDTVGIVYYYENNVLQDSLDFPFMMPFSSSTGTSGYNLVGADSIYFTAGSLSIGTGTTATQPAGLKYKLEGNKLTMSFKASRDTSFVESGLNIRSRMESNGFFTLVK